MEAKCPNCISSGLYSCESCTDFKEFCNDHASEHINKNPNHCILSLKNSYHQVNLASKSAILIKLKTIYKDILGIKKTYIQQSIEQIVQLEKKIDSTLADINNSLKICIQQIKKISKIKYVRKKKFSCHLEWALYSEDIDFFLGQVTLPSLAQNDYMIEFIPSNFLYVFNNYKTISLKHKENAGIFLIPQDFVFNDLNYKISSRALQISYSELLITGGSGEYSRSAKILNIATRNIESLPSLNIGRKFHTLTFIDGFPAVLGGAFEVSPSSEKNLKQLKSVEVFKNNEWQRISDLNLERSCISAVYTGKYTWAFGGFGFSTLDSIEKFVNGKWILLEISLPFPVRSSLTYALGDNILIIGGKISGGKDTNSVLYFNPNSEQFIAVRSLQFENNFPQNCFYLENGGTIHAFGELEALTSWDFALN
ncbi:hypothetical protein SteCoe_34023 [Stentor coeruleus]|uniref:B box-type domain-containing protein n=1 Tax=Stentor coeruleus TaxID=5963 RepID=A0A1R2AVT3_9CILI|nr:hypothetical protein SteCoe_34023 [Stentor coeruleus]